MPVSVEEWERMLEASGCTVEVVEDWSGIERYWKMRPGHRWSARHPSDFLTVAEKLRVFPKVVARHGPRALADLYHFRSAVDRYLREGVLGYALLAARKRAG